MNIQFDALKARVVAVAIVFLASACVIQKAAEPADVSESDDDEAPPAKAPAKAVAAKAPAPAKAADTKVGAAKAPTSKASDTKVAEAKTPEAKVLDTKVTTTKSVKLNRVARYVMVDNLNVRTRAQDNAPIVGRLAKGSMVTVSVESGWAKIGDQQFVSVKFLSKAMSDGRRRLVSRK